jgi:endonuclease/exonuclease/phosphatase family metal-dependent hydrolase
MRLRVLTWNLLHGRAVPPAGHDLFEEFAGALAGWEWHVALLQEVPPWWPSLLAARLDAEQRSVLTSRNFALAVRRAVAVRRPDLIKSNGGGANAILVRGEALLEHRARRLRIWPERRWVHAVRLGCGAWVANVHGQSGRGAAADTAAAARAALEWAAGAPCVLGGDFNTRAPQAPGFALAGGNGVDHVLVRGMISVEPARVLEHAPLSDHAPVIVALGTKPGEAAS